ncbi:MAG TPA: acetylornithine/succinylornithine family transaminase, partial [Bacillota bacterium]|nr:acetylornithine/succinylornithine family transaminase [Bacillota bacterium]
MLIKEMDQKYIVNTYSRFPILITSGKGSILKDDKGKEYIDMGSGIGVNIFGVADQEWLKAVTGQLENLQHTSNLYYTEPCARLAKIMCDRTGMKKVFFSNSGAEANECAIKAARKYAADKKGKDFNEIITLKDSFHGRTITTLAATGQDTFHKDFLPLTPGFVYAKANDLADLTARVKENKTAAIMFEIIQGEGGVKPLTKEFISGMASIAKENDILLIIDEVQTGNGRCGSLYSYMDFDITPDIVTTAKGLGGGLPIGATMLGEKVEDVLGPGSHGSTYGGNPISSAAAINVLSRIDQELMSKVKEKSQYIKDELKEAKGVVSVTGRGLMLGIETTRDASELVGQCMEKGVLVLTAKDKIRLLPP